MYMYMYNINIWYVYGMYNYSCKLLWKTFIFGHFCSLVAHVFLTSTCIYMYTCSSKVQLVMYLLLFHITNKHNYSLSSLVHAK